MPTLHAPHQAPADWIARFKGKFNQGWDEVRKQTLSRQIKAGIVPNGTNLSARPAVTPNRSETIPGRNTVSSDIPSGVGARQPDGVCQ